LDVIITHIQKKKYFFPLEDMKTKSRKPNLWWKRCKGRTFDDEEE